MLKLGLDRYSKIELLSNKSKTIHVIGTFPFFIHDKQIPKFTPELDHSLIVTLFLKPSVDPQNAS